MSHTIFVDKQLYDIRNMPRYKLIKTTIINKHVKYLFLFIERDTFAPSKITWGALTLRAENIPL